LPADRIVIEPLVVDNDWWRARSAEVDRAEVRRSWNVPDASRVILYCAKFQAWKRPMDLLDAFARAQLTSAFLVFAGEGPLRKELRNRAQTLGVRDRVRFLGFVSES